MTDGLDDAFRTTTRLRIMAFLSGCEEAEFGAVQRYCGVTQSNLSKNVAILDDAGYVGVRKGHVGKFPRTWLALTPAGATALDGHLAALRWISESAARHARRT